MLKSYFKVAWRNILRDRQFTILNLVGLSIGLATALLIWLWVSDEMKVDKYNENDSRLYQVMTNVKTDGGIKTATFTPGLLGKELKENIPEIKYSVSILPASWFPYKGTMSYGDAHIKGGGEYVGKDFFNVFTCHFIAGNKNDLINNISSVALSEEMAMKLFHTTDNIIGKQVKWDLGEMGGTFLVTGVFEKNPEGSTEQFDLLFNYDYVLKQRPNLLIWTNSDPNTYVVLQNGASLEQANKKISHFLDSRIKNTDRELFLAKYSSRYLYGNYENGKQAGGRIAYVKLFSLIAIFILTIACINFMNLSTAKASRRSKEVGIKKVVGASRISLVMQYLGESVIMSLVSLVFALIIIFFFLPSFNDITGKHLMLNPGMKMISIVIGITLFTGILAGSYPAFYLSGFKPVTVLKGIFKTPLGELLARKGLVVFQFTLSVIFIAGVMVIYRQIRFIQSKNLGYDRSHIIHFEIPLSADSVQIMTAATFISELNNIPGVNNASSYYHNLTGAHGIISGFQWPGKDPRVDIAFSNLEVGYNFLETVGIKIKEGRNFSKNANTQNEIVFNETAIKLMGLKDPVGKTVRFWGMDRQIIGVAEDFNFESLYQNVKPVFFQVYPVMPNVMVNINPQTEKQTIQKIKETYARFNPGMAFEYKFLDDDYQALYASETRVGILSRYFAGLAIIISCLGLFGLAAFTAQRRQKEIGIRKVIGASISGIAFLLSKDFVKLVLISMLIAFPLVWWAMNDWLNEFAYRVNIGWDIFVITGLSALFITIATISFQSVKSALMNPVKSLRSE